MKISNNEFYYTAKHKPNQLIHGSGQAALITGWTIKEVVCKHLDKSDYAVVGQLYSPTRGISLLVRNLLANPHVRYLVVLDATKEDKNAGGCQCLVDFFCFGVQEGISDAGRKSWVICSSVPGYIDIDIDIDTLNKLRNSVEVQWVTSIPDAVRELKRYAAKEPVAPWITPLEFPINILKSDVFPGTKYGHRIEGKTIAETWVKIIHRIKKTGIIRPTSYDGTWQELIDLMAIVTDEPDDFYFPEPNYLPIDRRFLSEYISQILDDATSQEGVKYTYGQRLRSWFGKDQIEDVINKLARDINSARAVMSLWDINKDDDNNPPCLNHIWVRVMDNELSLTATFRSNDMFSAWPANAMGLRGLQKYIYNALVSRVDCQLKMGALIIVSQSAHIYDDCFDSVANIIASHYNGIIQKKDYCDPVGSFVITIQNNQIIIEHTTPGSGEIINCYSGKSACRISQQIFADCPDLQTFHAMYIGSELQKAETALLAKDMFIYEQDKPLKLRDKEHDNI